MDRWQQPLRQRRVGPGTTADSTVLPHGTRSRSQSLVGLAVSPGVRESLPACLSFELVRKKPQNMPVSVSGGTIVRRHATVNRSYLDNVVRRGETLSAEIRQGSRQ